MTSNALARFLARCPLSPANEAPFGLVTHGFVWAEPSDALSALMVLGGQECACWKNKQNNFSYEARLDPRCGQVREHHIPFTGNETVALLGNSAVLHSKMQLCLQRHCQLKYLFAEMFLLTCSTFTLRSWKAIEENSFFLPVKLLSTPWPGTRPVLGSHCSPEWRKSLSRWWLCPSQLCSGASAECWKPITMP